MENGKHLAQNSIGRRDSPGTFLGIPLKRLREVDSLQALCNETLLQLSNNVQTINVSICNKFVINQPMHYLD
jgi:hypothetical protein